MAAGLVIPIRWNIDKAIAQLSQLSSLGKKAGDDVAKGMKGASDGAKEAGESTKGFGSELVGLMKAQIGLAAIKQTAGAIAGQFSETSAYVSQVAKEFQGLRKSMQEVATLKGSANTNQFTLEEARKAQKFNLSPTEFRDFQAQFQNYAGSQISDDPNRPGKLTGAQGEDYAGRVAQLMKGRGVSPAIGAELAGSLLENSKGPQDVDALMKRLSTTFTVLEKGRVPLAKALPELSQIMSMGVEAEDTAKMYSIVSPAAAGGEGTAVQGALRAVREMKANGSGAEFGVQNGMTPMESVRAFGANIADRKKALVAGGATDQMAEDQIQSLLMEKKVANDQREARGLVGGFARQGVEFGGFANYDKIAAGTSASFEADSNKRYKESAQGRQDAVDNAHAVSTAALGERNDLLERRRKIAEVELMDAGRFEHATGADRAGAMIPMSEDMRKQQVNRQMIARARSELGEGVGVKDAAASLNSGVTDELMRDLLKRIEENTRKNGPLVAPPGGNNNGPIRQ